MRYLMRQKIFALGDDFTIKDETGRDVYFVDGKALSFGDQLSFRDMQGNELAFIKQKLFAWGKTYELYRGGTVAAVVKKELFTFFSCRFTVDVPGPDDLELQGNLLDHEFTIRRGDQTVATVSKRWLALRDTYAVEIAEGEDHLLLLACVLALDLAEDREREDARERRAHRDRHD
jgi:uncharacterized protein YxjI